MLCFGLPLCSSVWHLFGLWARWEMNCVTLWPMSAAMMSCLYFCLHGLLDASPAKVQWPKIVVFVQNSDGRVRAWRVKFNNQLLNSCGGTFLSVIDGCILRADYGHKHHRRSLSVFGQDCQPITVNNRTEFCFFPSSLLVQAHHLRQEQSPAGDCCRMTALSLPLVKRWVYHAFWLFFFSPLFDHQETKSNWFSFCFISPGKALHHSPRM